jgi:hypothetical protein
MSSIPQRLYWNGPPERLPDAFRMTKAKADGVLTAVCELWNHELGFELRLMIDGHGLQMSSVVRPGEMFDQIESYQAAMLEKGWSLDARS